jgi:hypothetical protein
VVWLRSPSDAAGNTSHHPASPSPQTAYRRTSDCSVYRFKIAGCHASDHVRDHVRTKERHWRRLLIGMSRINQDEITSINTTCPTSQNAEQIPAWRKTNHMRPMVEQFSARTHTTDFLHCGEWRLSEFSKARQLNPKIACRFWSLPRQHCVI